MDALVSLVGAGPGDPSLLTIAAVRALSRADVVLYDALVHPGVLELARPDALRVFVGKRGGHEGISQTEINAQLVAHARAGRRVCRLKGGDPYLFGRGSEEAEVLAQAGVAFEVVPGVTAALGAGAYTGIALTHRALSSSVAFVTSSEHATKSESAHDWEKLATATQTLVIYMGARRVRHEMERLRQHGRPVDTPVAVVQWATRAEQRVVVGTLEDIADRCEAEQIGSPALVIVGRVVSLRAQLDWWQKRPLSGRRVLVLRAPQQCRDTLDALAERGADGWAVPVLEIAPPANTTLLDDAARRVATFRAVAFTSANAVESFALALRRAGADARALAGVLVASVGTATAQALEQRGLASDVVANESNGDGLAEALIARLSREGAPTGARVLLPRAERARPSLEHALERAGYVAEPVVAYRTAARPIESLGLLRAALRDGLVDAALLTSGSTVEYLCEVLGDEAATLLQPVTLASIGPTTSAAARAHGLTVSLEAPQSAVGALLDALEAHYARAAKQPLVPTERA